MKLALCLEYPIGQFGGTEVLVQELIRGLSRRHEIFLVSNDTQKALAQSPWKALVTGHFQSGEKMSRARGQELADRLREAGVELAHFHFGGNFCWNARAFGRCAVVPVARAGIPCLSTNHGAFSILTGFCGEQRSPAFRLALFPFAWLSKQYVLAHLRCEVAVSQFDYHALRRWYPPLGGKFRQIYHSRLHVPPPATGERTKHILCVGTIGPRKGQTFLTEAFCQLAERHADWKLVLIGRGGDAAMMSQIHSLRNRHRLDDRILLLGSQPDTEVHRWLRTAAIFVMPSLAEGLGLSLQEALFNGCACLACRAGGTQDLIQDGDNGLMVPAADASALAHALDRLMSDEAVRRHFRVRGPASILEKEMTAEKMVEKYEALYRGALAGH